VKNSIIKKISIILYLIVTVSIFIINVEPVFCVQNTNNDLLLISNDEQRESQFQNSMDNNNFDDGTNGPLGEWPDFTPIGYITAPHPDNPSYQTHLYGDWGGIVGEEFIFIQENKIKLLYHSYHETYITEHPHEEEILHNWALGYDPITKIKYTPLVSPGGPIPGPAWDHTDTPGYIQHPITGEHLIYNTVRPGTKYLHPEWDGLPGWEGAIQVATSNTSPSIEVPFNQTYENILVPEYWWEQGWNQNGVIKGGLSEPTPVWIPHLQKVRLFYRGLHGSTGSYWNWRISYADSEDGKTEWVKNPNPTWDPSDSTNPAYQWTLPYPEGFSFRGAWQAHCTGDIQADGVHMIMTVSNQNYAGGGHLAYYWSPDWGDTWIGHPDNPIIVAGQFPDGVPAEGFQRTPTLIVDDGYGRYILAYNAGHDVDESWKRRTYIAVASRPLGNINQSVFERGFPIRHAIDGDWAAAQSFIPTLNTLTSADIWMRKFGTPEFNLTVELREDHPQGTLIDTLIFSPAEVPNSWEWFSLDFTDTTVVPGTDYFIVCPPAPSGVTTSFGYEWGYAFGNQYDYGSFWFTRDGGGLWRDLPTMYEFCFRMYGIN